MAEKRSATEVFQDDFSEATDFKQAKIDGIKKHTLDSDEDDSGDDERY